MKLCAYTAIPQMMKYNGIMGAMRAVHMLKVGENARLIAEATAGHPDALDPDKAEALALWHDAGRYSPDTLNARSHEVVGFETFNKLGIPEIAHSCLTHAFPDAESAGNDGSFNISFFKNEQDRATVVAFLEKHKMTDYDNLCQFVDMISNHEQNRKIMDSCKGFQETYGYSQDRQDKFQKVDDVRTAFEEKFGTKTYDIIDMSPTVTQEESDQTKQIIKKADADAKNAGVMAAREPSFNFENIRELIESAIKTPLSELQDQTQTLPEILKNLWAIIAPFMTNKKLDTIAMKGINKVTTINAGG